MAKNISTKTPKLILRSCLPSVTSAIVSFVLAGVVVGIHLLTISLHTNTGLARIFGQGWVETFTTFIAQPVRNVLNNNVLNSLLTVLLWAIIGLIIYTIIERIALAFGNWRQANREVYRKGKQATVTHPQIHTLFVRMLWRFLISVMLVMLTILIQPLMRRLFGNDVAVFGKGAMAALVLVAINVAGWMAIEHVYLVLLRWYMFRTRVFGEIIY